MARLARRTAVWLLGVSLGLLSCETKKARIGSSSMAPTIKPNEVFRVDYGAYRNLRPDLWDVVIFDSPVQSGSMWCSRIVGLSGEVIDFKEGGLVVDGKLRASPARLGLASYSVPLDLPEVKAIKFPYTVPHEHLFVIGDNIQNSYDSRYLGGIAITRIKGKVLNK